MPETARTYGLTVDRWVDERLDPERSTEAATRFLADLYRRFGSWDLAMAAYNMGHGGLVRSIKKFNTNDFWQLGRHEAGIPWETSLYVPKILATAIAMNNKKSFGLDDVAPDPPEAFDVVPRRTGRRARRRGAKPRASTLPRSSASIPHSCRVARRLPPRAEPRRTTRCACRARAPPPRARFPAWNVRARSSSRSSSVRAIPRRRLRARRGRARPPFAARTVSARRRC